MSIRRFEITYQDPKTGEELKFLGDFQDTPGITAEDWAEDLGYSLADKGPFHVEEQVATCTLGTPRGALHLTASEPERKGLCFGCHLYESENSDELMSRCADAAPPWHDTEGPAYCTVADIIWKGR